MDRRREKEKKRPSQPQVPSTQERRPPYPPQIQPLTQSQTESVGNMSYPLY